MVVPLAPFPYVVWSCFFSPAEEKQRHLTRLRAKGTHLVAHDLACHYPSAPAPLLKQQIPHQTNHRRRSSSVQEPPRGDAGVTPFCFYLKKNKIIVHQKPGFLFVASGQINISVPWGSRGEGGEFTFLSASPPPCHPLVLISFIRPHSRHPAEYLLRGECDREVTLFEPI